MSQDTGERPAPGTSEELLRKASRLADEGHLEGSAELYEQASEEADRTVDDRAERARGALARFNRGLVLERLGRPDEAVAAYDRVVSRYGEASEPELKIRTAMALVNKGAVLGRLARTGESISASDEVVSRYGQEADAELEQQVALALLNKGISLDLLGRTDDAVAVYDEVVSRYDAAPEPGLRHSVARAMVSRGIVLQDHRPDDAVAAYAEVVSRFGDAPEAEVRMQAAVALFNEALVLGGLERIDDAVAAYDEVVSRYGDAPESGLRSHVATALFNKGFMLDAAGRTDDAIAAYDELASRFGDAPESDARMQAAMALYNKGFALAGLERIDDAVASYEDVVARYGGASETGLHQVVAQAMLSRGALLQDRRLEDALAAYDEVVARYGDAVDPELRLQAAMALYNRGYALDALARTDEAFAAYDEVVARYGDAAEPELRTQAAMALFNKGFSLDGLERTDAALASYEEVISRYGDAPEAELGVQAAMAMFNKAIILGRRGRPDEEIALYDEIMRRWGEAADADLRGQVAGAFSNKAITLGQLGRAEEEIALYDELVARYGDAPEAELRTHTAKAIMFKAVTLGQLGRPEEEIAVYDQLIHRYGDAAEADLRGYTAKAITFKAFTLGQLGHPDEEIALYDDVVARYGDAPEPELRTDVATAISAKAEILAQGGRFADEIAAYDEVVSRFGDTVDPELRSQVTTAMVSKTNRLTELDGRIEAAIEAGTAATEYEPTSVKAWVALGGAHRARSAFGEAIRCYDTALVHGPDGEAAVGKGLALEELGRYAEAIDSYCRVAQSDDFAPRAFHLAGYRRWKGGDYAGASKHFNRARQEYAHQLKAGTPDADQCYAYGLLLHEALGDLRSAERVYRQGLDLDPDHGGILTALVNLYVRRSADASRSRSSDYWSARTRYVDAREILSARLGGTRDAQTRLELGELALAMGDLEAAKSHLEKCDEMVDAVPFLDLGIVHLRKAEYEKAIEFLERAKAMDRDDLTIRVVLAQAYLGANRRDEALDEYSAVHTRAPENIDALAGLAAVFSLLGDAGDKEAYDDAEQLLSEAISLGENGRGSRALVGQELASLFYARGYARYKASLGTVVSKKRRLVEALEDFRRCHSLDPSHRRAARAAKQLGQYVAPPAAQRLSEVVGKWLVVALASALFLLALTSFFFGWPASAEEDKLGIGTVLFGSLIFIIAGLYLPDLLKISVAGVQLEKSAAERVAPGTPLLAITREARLFFGAPIRELSRMKPEREERASIAPASQSAGVEVHAPAGSHALAPSAEADLASG